MAQAPDGDVGETAGGWRRARSLWRCGNLSPRRWPPCLAVALWYLVLVAIPAVSRAYPDHWLGWWDQSLYLRSAAAFARGDLAASSHYYPILYPLLAAPFAWLPIGWAFVPAGLACVLLTYDGFRRVARWFAIGPGIAAALFVGSSLAMPWQIELWVIPWTTTASAAILWLALGLLADWSRARPHGGAAAFGALIVALPFARIGDAPVGAMIGLGGLAMLAAQRDWRAIGRTAIGGGIAAIALGGLYCAIYGLQATGYMRLSVAYGYDFANWGWRAQVILSSPRGWFGEGEGLVEALPWLSVGAAGLGLILWRGVAARRLFPIVLVGAAILYLAMMIAYRDLLPPALWTYHFVHYFKWLFPAFALGAAVLLMAARRRPAVLAALLPVIGLSMLRVEPVPVADDRPARLLVFAPPPGAAHAPLYFAASLIADRHGLQRNIFDYRQVLTDGAVRAIAFGRNFDGGERWIGNGGSVPVWPDVEHAQDGHVRLAGPWPRAPLARYASRLTIGAPCGIPLLSCE